MHIRSWWLSLSLLAGCTESTTSFREQQIVIPPSITGDTCTAAPGGYASCADALAATGATSGCFSIVQGLSPAVARSCMLKRVLVMQLANTGFPPVTPTADQAYLDAVLDNLAAFVDESSYGRMVLAIDVAGDQTLPSAVRWYSSTETASPDANQLGLLGPNDTPRPLADYNIFTTLSTIDKRSHTHACDVDANGTILHRSCNIVFNYRSPNADIEGNSTQLEHETGHSLGFDHDHALSSASGYGVGRATFDGQQIEYGGRSSIMGRGTQARYSLPERVARGWLNDGASGSGRHVVEVDAGAGVPASATVTFDTLEQDLEAKKGVYLPAGTGHYWIEARRDAAMDPVLRTGVLLHYGDPAGTGGMIDATPETASDDALDAALPIGRTYSDPVHGIYITARSETATTATVEIQRDPIDPNPPVIAAIAVIDCGATPARCPGAPAGLPGLTVWRYEVAASDADGDPLSYSWRFGVGASELANAGSYDHGAAVYRVERSFLTPTRAFVIVSDRKGKEATSTVSQPGYRAAWVRPAIASSALTLRPIAQNVWREDNQLSFQTSSAPTGTELLDYAWTIGTATSSWQQPIITPTAPTGASAPSCIQAELRVTDTSNCTAAPATCSAVASACVPVPLRLTYVQVPAVGIPTSFNLALSADIPALFGSDMPTITWDAACGVTPDPVTLLTATMPSPGCKVTVVLDGRSNKYAVTVIPH